MASFTVSRSSAVKRAKLVGIFDVAGEDDEAPRLRVAEERPLLRRQRQPGAAIDRARAHAVIRPLPLNSGPGSSRRRPP